MQFIIKYDMNIIDKYIEIEYIYKYIKRVEENKEKRNEIMQQFRIFQVI